MEGEQASCSHRETDWRDTSNLSASASWDSPASLRSLLRFSPKVMTALSLPR